MGHQGELRGEAKGEGAAAARGVVAPGLIHTAISSFFLICGYSEEMGEGRHTAVWDRHVLHCVQSPISSLRHSLASKQP